MTETMKIKLKPCPFCGGTKLMSYGKQEGMHTIRAYIACTTCNLLLHGDSCTSNEEAKESVYNKWNKRVGADDA